MTFSNHSAVKALQKVFNYVQVNFSLFLFSFFCSVFYSVFPSLSLSLSFPSFVLTFILSFVLSFTHSLFYSLSLNLLFCLGQFFSLTLFSSFILLSRFHSINLLIRKQSQSDHGWNLVVRQVFFMHYKLFVFTHDLEARNMLDKNLATSIKVRNYK